MFERYNEKARQTVFFARYEASQACSPYIQSHHLLLGLLRADAGWARRLFESHARIDALRERFPKSADKPPLSISVDLPLDVEAKRILAFAAEEAQQLGAVQIGVEHLLLGMAREEGSVAAKLLQEAGFTLARLREEVVHPPPRPAPAVPAAVPQGAGEGARDLTAAAGNGELTPLVGRERELDRIIHILCRRTKNNPVLIGEPGVGKSALVDGLAHRIAAGEVPAILAELKVLSMDAGALVAPRRRAMADFKAIICVEGLFDLAAQSPGWPLLEAMHVLEPRLARGDFRLIATGTPAGFRHTLEKAGALARHFELVELSEPDEDEAIRILAALQPQYERFHGVTFGEGALAAAVSASGRFLAHRFLPDRALDLIDEAAARVKLRREMEPGEVMELRRRIRALARDMENAIGNHDFAQARGYEETQRQEQETLERLLQKLRADEPVPGQVTAEDVAEAVAARTGLPIEEVKAVWQQPRLAEWQRLARELALHIPTEGNEWLPFLAAWLARSPAEAAGQTGGCNPGGEGQGGEQPRVHVQR